MDLDVYLPTTGVFPRLTGFYQLEYQLNGSGHLFACVGSIYTLGSVGGYCTILGVLIWSYEQRYQFEYQFRGSGHLFARHSFPLFL